MYVVVDDKPAGYHCGRVQAERSLQQQRHWPHRREAEAARANGMGPRMMDGHGSGWMSRYGGIWLPILLGVVVAGLVAWDHQAKR